MYTIQCVFWREHDTTCGARKESAVCGKCKNETSAVIRVELVHRHVGYPAPLACYVYVYVHADIYIHKM